MKKDRADILITELGLAESREKAKKIIMSGNAFIGTEKIMKPGEMIPIDAKITVRSNSLKYVSRGGYKLEKAIEKYGIDLNDKVAVDIGASTGGFTDCMLQNGARKVYAIDVGYGQLDYSLRINDKVVSMERTNIRKLDTESIEDEINFISIDVSFISLSLVLPVAKKLLAEDGELVALIKPQFEAGRDKVGKKGIVRDKSVHKEVLIKVMGILKDLNLSIIDITHSPIKGATGNVEFLVYCKNYLLYVEKEINLDNLLTETTENFQGDR